MNIIIFVGFALSAAYGHQVCYDKYGCFSDDPPFNNPLILLPEDPAYITTTFSLFTRSNKAVGQLLDPVNGSSISKTNFDENKRTVAIIHGYLGNSEEIWIEPMVDALLERDDMNVLVVDWRKGSEFPYFQAAGTSRIVGAQMTLLVKTIKEQLPAFDLSTYHCIGFGLGAHICGYVGRNFRKLNRTIGRISGLDPAGPTFEYKNVDVRLDPTDASFVDVIHSDTGEIITGVGISEALGHLDFYPNGGYEQPGCRKIDDGILMYFSCSHYRAVKYFTESINNKHCPFRSYACKNYDDFENGLCTKCSLPDCPRMGYNSIEHDGILTGKFYLRTFDKKPYCAHHYNIEFNTGSRMLADLDGTVNVIMTGREDVSEDIEIPDRYYNSGSKNNILIITRKNLGQLLKIKVSHGAWLDLWLLDSVVVRPMWTKNVYTGCFKRWLNNADNEVKLYTGQPAYCT